MPGFKETSNGSDKRCYASSRISIEHATEHVRRLDDTPSASMV